MDFFLLSVVLGSSFGLTSGFLWWNSDKNATVTNHTLTVTTAPPFQNEGFDPVRAEAGAIAGVVFGVLISAVFIAIASFIYFRRRRMRDREYMRRSNIQRMSKLSAGVYTDTTVDTNFRPSEAKTEGYKALRKDPNVFEDDSDDEL